MTLKEFMTTIPMSRRDDFARECGTTKNYLNMIRCGKKRPNESLCIALEKNSGGAVKCEELRPDVDWAYIRSTGCECKA